MKKQTSTLNEMKFEKFEIASIEKLNFVFGGGGGSSEDSIIETNEMIKLLRKK